jgi:dTDP-4-dehydrorhamnose 3,5-epimerase
VKFHETELQGAYFIDIEKHEDERGFFARTWCEKEFKDRGLVARVVQANTSFNSRAGTLRGMHYQLAPYQETRLVRCTRGALYDVIVDLRPDSPTYKRWIGVELTATNYRMLYVPADFAHGFITLEDNTEAAYLVSESYTPGAVRGLRWDDPQFNIEWPRPVEVISDKDASRPDFVE